MTGERLTPVIMCGGAGTRLWPVSRESMPKQFVPLIGDRSTFQQTLARVSDPDLFERPIVITNGDFRFIVAEQLRELGIEADIVLEPSRRDSGPAVAVAAALAMRRDPDATVLVLAADHVVHKTPEFHAACRSAAAAAAMGLIATFGIREPNSMAQRRSRSRRSSRSRTPRRQHAISPRIISGTAATSRSAPASCSTRSSASSRRWRTRRAPRSRA
jgi:mannose-1-phosphate guanylyltransferase